MRGQAGFFDVDERLRQISAKGDSLERLNAVIDFELFRADVERAVPRADRVKGGRPAFDHVLMFKTLILQANHNLSDERTEYLIRDRLSFMRFLGLGLADTVPNANTIWTFREALRRAKIAGQPAIVRWICERRDVASFSAALPVADDHSPGYFGGLAGCPAIGRLITVAEKISDNRTEQAEEHGDHTMFQIIGVLSESEP